MANNVPQAPQRPDVPEQNLQLSGDVFIPAQVSAGQVPVLDRSELKLPSNLKVFWMLLKVQITMIWTTQVIGARKNFEKKVGANALPIVGGIFVVVGTLFMMVYIYGIATTLAIAGFTRLLPLAGILVGALPGIILTFVKANGVLFAYKDYDFIMFASNQKEHHYLFSRSSSVCCRGYLVYCHYAASLFGLLHL